MLVELPNKFPREEIENYNIYCIARLSFTQAWTLANDLPSPWWFNRIICYANAEHWADKYRADKFRRENKST